MKPKSLLFLFLALAANSPLIADEPPNPFVKAKLEGHADVPPGVDCVLSQEQILVPPDLIGAWLDEHGTPKDATELRKVVQGWIGEGKAKLDHTVWVGGTVGPRLEDSTILEQIYATEYKPASGEVWPFPTAFETRNTGYGLSGVFGTPPGGSGIGYQSRFDVVETRPHVLAHPVVERTSQPGDVFIPTFQKITSGSVPRSQALIAADPFAGPQEKQEPSSYWAMAGAPRLICAIDPLPQDRAAGGMTRLAFGRGAVAKTPSASFAPEGEYAASLKVIRVPHDLWVQWLQERDPLQVSLAAEAAARQWLDGGKAETVCRMSATGSGTEQAEAESIQEFVYPTEAELPDSRIVEEQHYTEEKRTGTTKRVEPVAVPPGLAGAVTPTAFETRNTGITFSTRWTPGEAGGAFICRFEWVRLATMAIVHRILDGTEWVPDLEMPVFTSQEVAATVRLPRAKWVLLGSSAEFLENRQPDTAHRLLVFVKVE